MTDACIHTFVCTHIHVFMKTYMALVCKYINTYYRINMYAHIYRYVCPEQPVPQGDDRPDTTLEVLTLTTPSSDLVEIHGCPYIVIHKFQTMQVTKCQMCSNYIL